MLIINGVAGTGKSYLIRALTSYLQHKCVITATTGKAAYSIRGVTIHSLLKLPITPQSQRDLSGEALIELQHRLSNVDYILFDEYSMLGQKTLGWIDRRCRQSSGVKEHLFFLFLFYFFILFYLLTTLTILTILTFNITYQQY